MKKSASTESIAALCTNMGNLIKDFGKELDEIFSYYEALVENPGIGSSEGREFLLSTMDALTVSEMAILELSAYLKAEMSIGDEVLRKVYMLNIERISADYLLSLFGYSQEDKAKSIWHRFSVTHQVPEELTQELISQSDSIIGNNDFWKKRNVASHLDFDIKKVQDAYISEEDEDRITKFVINIWDILLPVKEMASAWWKEYNPKEHIDLNLDINNYIDSAFCKNIKCQEAVDAAIEIQLNSVNDSSNWPIRYDFAIKKLQLQKSNGADGISKSLKIAALGDYLLLEYLGSIKAALLADNVWERRVCMKRAYSLSFDVLDKIIGFDEVSQSNSCISSLEALISTMDNEVFTIRLDSIKDQLNTIIKEFGLDDEKRRNTLTHTRYEDEMFVLDQFLLMKDIRIMDLMGASIMLRTLFYNLNALIPDILSEYSQLFKKKNVDNVHTRCERLRNLTSDSRILEAIGNLEKQLLDIASR